MKQPEISIIIPVFNTEPYLEKCIDSVLTQTFINFECILVDDKSRDKSLEICNFYAQKDRRVKIIQNKKNIGSSLSRKAGLDASSGLYIQFIDSDDWIENDMLEMIYKKAVLGNYDIVYCDAYGDYPDGTSEYRKIVLDKDKIKNIRHIVLGWNKRGVGLVYKFVRRSIYTDIIFPTEGYVEDRFITTQMFYKSEKIGYINKAFYHVWLNPNSQERSKTLKMKMHRYKGMVANYQNIFNFLKNTYGGKINLFEPELSNRIKWLQNLKNENYKKSIKRILKIIIPFKSARSKIRSIYKGIKCLSK